MQFVDIDGNRVYVNPNRIDSMKECAVGPDPDDLKTAVRIHVYSATYTTYESFDSLTGQITANRK